MRYVTIQLGVLCLAGFFSQLAHGVTGMAHMTTVFLVFALTAGVNFTVFAQVGVFVALSKAAQARVTACALKRKRIC